MADSDDLTLKKIWIDEKDGKCRFTVMPQIHCGESVVLSREESGETILAEWTAKTKMPDQTAIEKSRLAEKPYAYIAKKKKDTRGTPVRILTRQPDVRQILLMPGGKIRMAIDKKDDFSALAGLLIEIFVGEKRERDIYLDQTVYEFDLAQAGIVDTEREMIKLKIRFHTQDLNLGSMAGVPTEVKLVLNPPEITRVVREETQIILRLAEESRQPLYARLCRDGRPLPPIACMKGDGTKYVISTERLNLAKGTYTVEIACRNELTFSYWSEAVPVLMERPVIKSVQASQKGRKIRMEESGCYFCQEKYVRDDSISVDGREIPKIRYADQYGAAISLSLPAKMPEDNGNCFYQQNGYYCLADKEDVCPLRESYDEYQNKSFRIEVKDGKAYLHIKDCHREEAEEDFRLLLKKVCRSYEGLEELTGCFGNIPLKVQDMLSIRYGYDAWQGACDLHAGMELCFDYEQYQNILEGEPVSAREEPDVPDQELSGFTGNGSSIFPCILRDGKISFEPFAQGMSEVGAKEYVDRKIGEAGMVVEPTAIGKNGRIGMGAGIWDALFAGFSKPFVRLLCPAEWKKSEYKNYGSLHYSDNICLISADTYEELQEASCRFYSREDMLFDTHCICFRGRTAVRIMIHIFVEGHPQICALGTTLGDISAAYGLGSRVRLERFCGGRHVPFEDAGMDIPLYIGDRICSK